MLGVGTYRRTLLVILCLLACLIVACSTDPAVSGGGSGTADSGHGSDRADTGVSDASDLVHDATDSPVDTARACPASCDTLPQASCDGNVAVTYAGSGVCDPSTGTCDYSAAEVRTDCAQSNQICQNGACAQAGPCDLEDCGGHGSCSVVGGEALCDCEAGFVRVGLTQCLAASDAGACGSAGCPAQPQDICQNDASAADGYTCGCRPGYVLVEGSCVQSQCGDNVIRTGTTLFDTTPLPSETDPIGNGFDPLLQHDRVRIHIAFERRSGTDDAELHIALSNLGFVAGSVLVDGQPTTAGAASGVVTIALPPAAQASSGDVSLKAEVLSPSGIVSVDVSARTAGGCVLPRSRSAVKLQVAGDIDPKGAGCLDMSDYTSLQITPDIPEKDTSVYQTRNGDSAVYPGLKVLHQVTLCLERSDDRTVSLSGSADGTRPWMVDNYLLIETFDGNPAIGGTRTGAYITTARISPYPSRTSLTDGTPLEVVDIASLPGEYVGGLSPSSFTFPSGVLQLDDFLPVGQQVWVRFTGLDEGNVGRLTRIFLTSSGVGEAVPECRSIFDCAAPDVASYASGWAISGGCIQGQCVQHACSADGDCASGQRCVRNYCTDGCSSDTQCGSGQTCAHGSCVDTSAGGCADYTDCSPGEVCQFGQCVAGCYHPRHQKADYSDNYYSGFCQNHPNACPRCGTVSNTCWNNYCRECEIDAHCPAGESCVQFKCVSN